MPLEITEFELGMPRNVFDDSERQQNTIKCLGFNWKINDEKI